jgi:hypothetical protein
MLPAGRFVVLGNPAGRRVRLFAAALEALGLPPPTLVSYRDLLAGRDALTPHLAPGCVVRIDSPDEDFELEREILAQGAEEAAAEGAPALEQAQSLALPFERGRIRFLRQWYLGLRRVLRRLAAEIAAATPRPVLMSCPQDIEIMFDKPACHALFSRAGLPVPRALGPVSSFDELRERMRTVRLRRVFVKPSHGASGCGVVALETDRGRWQAHSAVELLRQGGELRLYNSVRVRRTTALRDIAAMIDALCKDGVHVEQWVPKAVLGQDVFDLRVLLVAGVPRHSVLRMGRTPVTNLHLRNRRGDVALLCERMDPAAWSALLASCTAAATLFPRSLHAGLDVLVEPGLRRHRLLEINAFGDLLPRLLHEGVDTYTAELLALGAVPREAACSGT